MTLIATWNVNSIKARLPRFVEWLGEFQPDVALLQELKTVDETFPRAEIEELGYNVETHGQKTYNGVAILSKDTIDVTQRGLPGDDTDKQARYLEANTFGLRVASIYLPNGNPILAEDGGKHEKFTYKLGWMDRLVSHAKDLLAEDIPLVLAGDYNVCPTDDDVYDVEAFANDALCQPESREPLGSSQSLVCQLLARERVLCARAVLLPACGQLFLHVGQMLSQQRGSLEDLDHVRMAACVPVDSLDAPMFWPRGHPII